MVIKAQIACEIDIRTLTSHQVFGIRKDGRGGGGEIQFYRSTGTENTVHSSTGTEKYSFTGLRKSMY